MIWPATRNLEVCDEQVSGMCMLTIDETGLDSGLEAFPVNVEPKTLDLWCINVVHISALSTALHRSCQPTRLHFIETPQISVIFPSRSSLQVLMLAE